MKSLLVCVAMACLVSGCMNPEITKVSKGIPSGYIYVARFEGNPNYAEAGTTMFVTELRARSHRNVIQGDALRGKNGDAASSTNAGLAAARKAGAQTLILGKVTAHQTTEMMNGLTTISVIRVSDGVLVATFQRASNLLGCHSESQSVKASSKRTAHALAKHL